MFFCGVLFLSLENASENAPVNINELKTPDAIIELLKSNQQLTRKEMAELIGKDIRTIGRAIKTLQENGRLQRIGSDKTGYWKLL